MDKYQFPTRVHYQLLRGVGLRRLALWHEKNTGRLGLITDSPLPNVVGLNAACPPVWAISLNLASPVYSDLRCVRKLEHIGGWQVADVLITLQNVLEISNSKRTLTLDY